jgi:hypothetical protein
MKGRVVRLLNLILALIVSLLACGYTYAWLIMGQSRYFDFGGSSANAYFAGGSGTALNPYIISDGHHLYNLAWLQNTGRFGSNAYCFALGGDLTLTDDLILPPIGNDDYPFAGTFNGGGYTITNLKISTNKNVISEVADSSVTFSNSVGMFGNTASGAVIKNFILNNAIVEVADEDETLTAVDTEYSTNSVKVAGLAVGHVSNGAKVSSVGAIGGYLSVRRSGYTTFNSILGGIGENVSSAVTGGGNSTNSGGGNSYGGAVSVSSLLDRLNKIKVNKASDTPSWKLPAIDNSSNNPLIASGEKMAFTVEDNSNYSGSSAEEIVSGSNIGYFLGNQNKTGTFSFVAGSPRVEDNGSYVISADQSSTKNLLPMWLYTYKTSDGSYNTIDQDITYSKSNLTPLSESEYVSLPMGIKNLIADVGTTITYSNIRLSGASTSTSLSSNNASWSYHGQLSWMGKTYGQGVKYTDSTVVDENGNRSSDMYDSKGNALAFYKYDKGVYLPNTAIWFKPVQSGYLRFVMVSTKDNEGFTLRKINRSGATSSNPFAIGSTDVTITTVIDAKIPTFTLIYYEVEVTQNDIDNFTEYYLSKSASNGAYFLYLDVGASGIMESSSSGDYDETKGVSAIDFVYDGVSISDGTQVDESGNVIKAGNFIEKSGNYYRAYTATATSIYLGDYQKLVVLAFVRQRATFNVNVYPASQKAYVHQTGVFAIIGTSSLDVYFK